MGLSLQKGQALSLKKNDGGALTRVRMGLGWDSAAPAKRGLFGGLKKGAEVDLDASAIFFDATGNALDTVFFNQLKSKDGSTQHTGDNRTGEGDGDDEQIKIVLSKTPAEVEKVAVAVTIHDGESRGQSFGQVSNAFIRIVDAKSGTEIVRYDLSEDASVETAMILGEVYRNAGEWKFRAVGQGFKGGLGPLASNYGVNIG